MLIAPDTLELARLDKQDCRFRQLQQKAEKSHCGEGVRNVCDQEGLRYCDGFRLRNCQHRGRHGLDRATSEKDAFLEICPAGDQNSLLPKEQGQLRFVFSRLTYLALNALRRYHELGRNG
jgi:hypothetical protein